MTVAYISLQEAKDQVRAVSTLDDDLLGEYIQSASAVVKNYLGEFSAYEIERDTDDDPVLDSNFEPENELDGDGNQIPRPEVKMAVRLLVARWYRGREAGADDFGQGRLPPDIEAILYPMRDPACQ